MTTTSDILIIGGGISGMLTARELRLAGRNVTIIDKSATGQESSWAGGGILLPIYPWRQAPAISKLVSLSLKKFPGLSQELRLATGIDPEWRDCGMLICKNPDFAKAVAWCHDYHIDWHPPEQQVLADLHTQLQQPLWLPGIAQIRNPRLLQALKANLLNLGVTFLENTAIQRIDTRQRRITQLLTSTASFSLQQLVICSGAWTNNVLQTLLPGTVELPIQPVKGQMLVFAAQPDTLPCMVLDGDHYLIPRRDGKILAGSTVEVSGFDKSTTNSAKQALYEFATQLLPVLKESELIHHWAGLRPGTPEGIPYIGFHPDFDNLSINAGHFRNGLVMSPASAQLLADLILERPLAIDPSPYALT
ncbi:glycine oxidase ThiO [Methylomonas paludis]|uniref:Glycine oxidase ThiO n=1 Tax=Methylomonas paludis TaxID=1173101 RepID=A0A975MMQ5_9GAMM|nr:glycine oxidase ThiO [Methylomonas paludis]QWF70657.1 glycine oxidase ThiO [Methylomonas paludis]